MNVLVLGSGGREHALAWRIKKDASVSKVWVMPGNPGMSELGIEPLLKELSVAETLDFCRAEQVSFVMVGPEKYLIDGWVDQLSAAGIPAVGPTARAARLEQSKSFSKAFMVENHIPTARFYNVCDETAALQSIAQIEAQDWAGIVVKLSGPALGKGVVVAKDANEAKEVIRKFYEEKSPGIEEGMVIEEKLSGAEVSLFYACLDDHFRFLASACDHKRLLDLDQGPNTGGMGAISPAPFIDDAFLKRIEERMVKPTLEGLRKAGSPYRGILFLGLMKESLLEYNVRFGDPETQTILPLLEGDFTALMQAIATGNIEKFRSVSLRPNNGASVHIVKAAKGYPGLFGEKIQSGMKIEVCAPLEGESGDSKWFFAGVKQGEHSLLTSGGRVLGISVWGKAAPSVQKLAYQKINEVKFSGEQYRTDIGVRR